MDGAAIAIQFRTGSQDRPTNVKNARAIVADHSRMRVAVACPPVGFVFDRDQKREAIRRLPTTIPALIAFAVANPITHGHPSIVSRSVGFVASGSGSFFTRVRPTGVAPSSAKARWYMIRERSPIPTIGCSRIISAPFFPMVR